MIPVNRAGSVSEITPRHSFFRKNFDVFYSRSWTGSVTEISVFATEISVTGMKILLYEHSSRARITGTTFLTQNSFAFAT